MKENRKIIKIWRVFILLILLHSYRAKGDVEFAGGTGEPNDPYQIATAEQLISIDSDPNLLNKHFILVNDIDLDPNLPGRKVFDRAVIGSFDGVFNGNGHIISNLTITGYSYLGLFGKMSGRVLNLGIEDALIVGNGNSRYLGGLVGENNGSIVNCYVTCAVSGSEYLGGLVGRNISNTITNCYATGSVCGEDNSRSLGGLVGGNDGNISNCYAAVSVQAGDNAEYLDGLVGLELWPGSVTNCFYDIEASKLSKESIRGLTTAEMQDPNTFLDAGWDMVGERANGTTELWQMPEDGGYPVLTVFSDTFRPRELAGVGTTEEPYRIATAENLGAINHYDSSACYKLVADINLSNITWTTAPIADFDGTLDGDGFTVSNLSIKGGSYLGLFRLLGPSAIVKNMIIEDANIVSKPNDRCLGTIAAINRGSIEYCCSTGNVSDGFAPPAIYQSSASIGGLVGINRGSITNCNTNVQVSGRFNRGGLVGSNVGSITSCYTIADVTGGLNNFSIGGLVGYNVGGSITNCYSTGDVSGGSDSEEIGGLVGYNSGCIMNCYAIGNISSELSKIGSDFFGGLVGLNKGSITNCYSTGSIFGGDNSHCLGGICGMNESNGSIIKCYATGSVFGGNNSEYLGGLVGFNTKSLPERLIPGGIITSCYLLSPADGGGPDNGLGSLLTDEQMKQKSSFIDWDFENIWMICEGKDYPRLQWENVQCENE